MDGTIILEVAITFALIVANGFFAASEIALVSARRGRLEQQARAGSRGARQALTLSENSDRFLATVQVGVTLISTIASAFGGARISAALAVPLRAAPLIGQYADAVAFTIVVLLITYFTLVIGELVPKRLGLNHAERVAARVAPAMTTIARLTRPVIALLTLSVSAVLRMLGQAGPRETSVTEEDIVYLTHAGATSGAVEAGEERLIRRVFRFTDRRVAEVMTARPDIIAIDASLPLDEIRELFLTSGHSRLPVYEGTLDDIIGVLLAKDLLRALAPGQPAPDLHTSLRPATFTPERQRIADLLTVFRRDGAHLALAVDEYGQITGLVTLKDILEELVGDIRDAYDVGDEDEEIKRLDDGAWLVSGGVAHELASEQIGLPPIPADEVGEYTTVAGLVLTRLGRIPGEGDTVRDGDFTLQVVDMDGRRIDKLRIQHATAEKSGMDDTDDTSPRGLA
ncbi:MAG TPA: hemolysin family protein [Ktedonobacterales bacterium]|jgi:putative hemolysin|nr:hemolysin family protein [Ktedonobacterales bacterium]